MVHAQPDDGRTPDHPVSPVTSPASGEWRTVACERQRAPHVAPVGDGTTMPVTPPELAAAMARIDDVGRGRFADSYAGLEVDQERVCAVVHRVPSRAFDEAVVAAAGEQACVVVRDAPHALAELADWHQRVVDDLPLWSSQGVAISTVGARHDGAGVEIGVEDVPRARRELTGRYGDTAPLIFVQQGPVTAFPQG